MNKYLLLFAIFCSSLAFCQPSDSTRRQVEISGAGYRLNRLLFTQFALGVNFPAKKDNWYNNLALSVNTQDATKRSGVIFTIYSLSVGKSYQHINRHFFGTLGINSGPYYGVFTSSSRTTRHIGVNAIPKAEIGYNMKNTILSTGVYFSMGVGYRAEYDKGELVEYPRPQDYVRFTGALNLYLKLILK